MSVKNVTQPQQLLTGQEVINKEFKNHVINAARDIKAQPREINASFFEVLCWKIAYFFTGDPCYSDRLSARENYLNELMNIFVGCDYNDKTNSYNLHFRTSNGLGNDGDSVIEIYANADGGITSIQGQNEGILFNKKVSNNLQVNAKDAISNLCQQAFVYQLNESRINGNDSIVMSIPCQEKYCSIPADILNEGWPGLSYLEQGFKNGKISIETLAKINPPDYATLKQSGLTHFLFDYGKYLEMFIRNQHNNSHVQECFICDSFDSAINDTQKIKVIMASINTIASVKFLEKNTNFRIDGMGAITYALKNFREEELKNMYCATDITLNNIIESGRLGDCKSLWKTIYNHGLATSENLKTGKCPVTEFINFIWSDMGLSCAKKLIESKSIDIEHFRKIDNFDVFLLSFSECDINEIISLGFNFSEIKKIFPQKSENDLLKIITENHKTIEFLTDCFFDETTLMNIASSPDGYAVITQDNTLSTALKNEKSNNKLSENIRNILFLALEKKDAKHSVKELLRLGFTENDYYKNSMLQKLYFDQPEVAIRNGFNVQAIMNMGFPIEDAIRAAVDSKLTIDQLVKSFFDSKSLKYVLIHNEELTKLFTDDHSISRELLSGTNIAIKDVFPQLYNIWGPGKCFSRGFTVADFIQAGKINDCLVDRNKWIDAIKSGVKIDDFIKHGKNVSELYDFVYDSRDKISYSTLISFFTSDKLEQFMRKNDDYLTFIVKNEDFNAKTFKSYGNINSLLNLVPKEMQYSMIIKNNFRAPLFLETGFISNHVKDIVTGKYHPDEVFYNYLINNHITYNNLLRMGVDKKDLTSFVLADNNQHFNRLISTGFFSSTTELANTISSAKDIIHVTHFDEVKGSVAESVRKSGLDIEQVISSVLNTSILESNNIYLSGLGFRYTDIINDNTRLKFMKDNPFCWMDVYNEALNLKFNGDIFEPLNSMVEVIKTIWEGIEKNTSIEHKKNITDRDVDQFIKFFLLDAEQCRKIPDLVSRIGLHFMKRNVSGNNWQYKNDVMNKIKEFGLFMSDIDDKTLKDNTKEIQRFICAFANGGTDDLLSIGFTNDICNKLFSHIDTFSLAMGNSKAPSHELAKAGFDISFITKHGDINIDAILLDLKNKSYSPSFVKLIVEELHLTKQYFTEKGVDIKWLKKQIINNEDKNSELRKIVKKDW